MQPLATDKAWLRGDTYHAESSRPMETLCQLRMGPLDRYMLRQLAATKAQPCPRCYHNDEPRRPPMLVV